MASFTVRKKVASVLSPHRHLMGIDTSAKRTVVVSLASISYLRRPASFDKFSIGSAVIGSNWARCVVA